MDKSYIFCKEARKTLDNIYNKAKKTPEEFKKVVEKANDICNKTENASEEVRETFIEGAKKIREDLDMAWENCDKVTPHNELELAINKLEKTNNELRLDSNKTTKEINIIFLEKQKSQVSIKKAKEGLGKLSSKYNEFWTLFIEAHNKLEKVFPELSIIGDD